MNTARERAGGERPQTRRGDSIHRERSERPEEWGEAPDEVVLVSEANESSSELASDGVLVERLPSEAGATAP